MSMPTPVAKVLMKTPTTPTQQKMNRQIRRPYRSAIHDAIHGVMIFAAAPSVWESLHRLWVPRTKVERRRDQTKRRPGRTVKVLLPPWNGLKATQERPIVLHVK